MSESLGFNSKTVSKRLLRDSISLDEQVRSWIEDLLGISITGSLEEELKSGVLLCRCINQIFPDKIKRINTSNKLAFHQMENINKFLQACGDIGLQRNQLFTTIDLFEGKDMKRVLTTIAELSALLVKKIDNYEGPVVVRGTGESPAVKRKIIIKTNPMTTSPFARIKKENNSTSKLQQNLNSDIKSTSEISSLFDEILAGAAVKWINEVISWDELTASEIFDDIELSEERKISSEAFYDELKDGIKLCKAFNRVCHGSDTILTIHQNVGKNTFKYRENVEMYLSACQNIGMASTNCFSTNDLIESKNLPLVVSNIFSLSSFVRKAVQINKFSWGGPLLEVVSHRSKSTSISILQRVASDTAKTIHQAPSLIKETNDGVDSSSLPSTEKNIYCNANINLDSPSNNNNNSTQKNVINDENVADLLTTKNIEISSENKNEEIFNTESNLMNEELNNQEIEESQVKLEPQQEIQIIEENNLEQDCTVIPVELDFQESSSVITQEKIVQPEEDILDSDDQSKQSNADSSNQKTDIENIDENIDENIELENRDQLEETTTTEEPNNQTISEPVIVNEEINIEQHKTPNEEESYDKENLSSEIDLKHESQLDSQLNTQKEILEPEDISPANNDSPIDKETKNINSEDKNKEVIEASPIDIDTNANLEIEKNLDELNILSLEVPEDLTIPDFDVEDIPEPEDLSNILSQLKTPREEKKEETTEIKPQPTEEKQEKNSQQQQEEGSSWGWFSSVFSSPSSSPAQQRKKSPLAASSPVSASPTRTSSLSRATGKLFGSFSSALSEMISSPTTPPTPERQSTPSPPKRQASTPIRGKLRGFQASFDRFLGSVRFQVCYI